jgi:hypothetical protein
VVRLTVEGRRFEQPLTLKLDPRVQLPAGALAEQLHFATGLAALLTDSSRALLTARSEAAQLKALKATGTAAQSLGDYQARLTALLEAKDDASAKPGAPHALLPEVQGHVGALYAEQLRGDAPPTAAQLAAAAGAREALTGLMADWRRLQDDLPDLNRQLKAAGLAPLRADLAPPRDVNAVDED